MPPAEHIFYIPAILLLGIVLGFVISAKMQPYRPPSTRPKSSDKITPDNTIDTPSTG